MDRHLGILEKPEEHMSLRGDSRQHSDLAQQAHSSPSLQAPQRVLSASQYSAEPVAAKGAFFALSILTILIFVTALNFTNTVASLPSIAVAKPGELTSGSSVEAFWVAISYLLAHAVSQPLVAAVSEIIGRSRLLILAVLFMALGSVITATAPNLTGIIAGRTILGVGAAGCTTLTLIIPSRTFPTTVQHKYVAVLDMTQAVGFVFGPLLGGAFAQHRNWRWMFLFNIPFCGLTLAAIPFAFGLKGTDLTLKQSIAKVDVVGIVLVVFSTTLLLMGISWGGILFDWDSPKTVMLFVIGIIGLVITAIWQRSGISERFIRQRLFYQRTANIAYFGTFAQGFVMFSHLYFVSLYLESVKDTSSAIVGASLLALLLPVLPAFLIARRLCQDVLMATRILWIGLIIETLACGLMILFDQHTPTAVWAIILLISGIGHGFTMCAFEHTIQSRANDADVISAANTSGFLRSLGMSFGVATSASVFLNLMKQKLEQVGAAGTLAKNAVELVADLKSIPSTFPIKSQILQAYVHGLRGVAGLLTALTGLVLALSLFMEVQPPARVRGPDPGAALELAERIVASQPSRGQSAPPLSPVSSSPSAMRFQPPRQSARPFLDEDEIVVPRKYVRNTSWFLGARNRPWDLRDSLPAQRHGESSP